MFVNKDCEARGEGRSWIFSRERETERDLERKSCRQEAKVVHYLPCQTDIRTSPTLHKVSRPVRERRMVGNKAREEKKEEQRTRKKKNIGIGWQKKEKREQDNKSATELKSKNFPPSFDNLLTFNDY